ncbi:head GIN domain-containing protein [Flavobacterium sp. MMLR14_040]|uniref:head GIN domain-containing protein n=1 Tax=Flavobacterium sp. MMLR14_040 TaxID=3093843 RepID=UPI00298F75FE|nr:head GIN domain-containing protein [Flavobacterium sp. MMLR14_040]MDW8853073.1 head GIN domain-containing protein [Flavobacterium sp. MMLR14_040]
MKKSIQLLVFGAFIMGFIANAQSSKIKGNGKVVTETKTTGDYDAIKVAGSFDINLVAGKEGKIILKGEENLLSVIKVEVEDNTLKIYVDKTFNIQSTSKIEITVPFEKISAISLAGSGDVKTKDQIKSDTFAAKLSGSGNFNLNVNSNDFQLNLSGSGDVTLKGSADKFTSKLAGSGNVNASDFKSKNVEANVAGSGNSIVNCEGNLTARVSGSGNIKYFGNPEKRDVKVSGSGNIKKG